VVDDIDGSSVTSKRARMYGKQSLSASNVYLRPRKHSVSAGESTAGTQEQRSRLESDHAHSVTRLGTGEGLSGCCCCCCCCCCCWEFELSGHSGSSSRKSSRHSTKPAPTCNGEPQCLMR
jgi:hypothetical protein